MSVPKTMFQLSGRGYAAANLSHATLVIIDAQKEYLSGPLALSGMDAAVGNIKQLVAAARNAGRPIVHVRHLGTVGGLFDPQGERGEFIPGLEPMGNETIIGEGEYQYRAVHNFAQLPDKYSWQTTHNVALDSAGNLYVIHEGRRDLKDHPSIFVFDPAGKFIRAFGAQFQGGGHGIEIRKEGSQEFLYVAAYQQVKAFARLVGVFGPLAEFGVVG